jgi:hypothetical protein
MRPPITTVASGRWTSSVGPRIDVAVAGERGVRTMEPNLAAEERILAGHAKFFASLGG